MPPVSSISQDTASRNERRSWSKLYFGVAVTTLASLLLELSLTRIFSVVFYYHFAFLAISIALFGLGVGGVFSYVVADWRGTLNRKLGILALCTAVSVVAALLFVLSRQGDLSTAVMVMIYFACALPFLLSGTVVSLAIADSVERVDRVYFFDLMGAAGGCVVLVPLLNWIGGPDTIMVAAILYAVSAAVWFNMAKSSRGRVLAVGFALVLVALITVNSKAHLIDVRYAKGQKLKNEEFFRWNSFSRIGLIHEPHTNNRSIVIDGDAETGVANFNFSKLTQQERDYLAYHGPGFPYVLRPAAKTLVIGPGGGWDVSRALASGSRDVTGVEINPIIANWIMREKFPQYSQNLYLRPDVHIVVEDGRSFVRRTEQRFQVIQATLVDTWASTAAGAFALSENNLYTTDAFYDYLTHLTPDGIAAFTRWGFAPPRESLRVVSLARAALARMGMHDPQNHVMVLREDLQKLSGWGAQDTILISRNPFASEDVARIHAALAHSEMTAVYLPGTEQASAFRDLLLSQDADAFYRGYEFDVRPVNDNRPFFFYTVQARDLWNYFFHAARDTADYKINKAVPLLFGLVFVSILATCIVLALPPFVLGQRLPAGRGARRALLYFLSIGAGYILIQVALIQKFVLFLGHPTYALTVIIFSMLVASGLGSFYSRRLLESAKSRITALFLTISLLVSILALTVGPITSWGVFLPLPAKMLISVAMIAPVAFLMGMPFPSGLSRLEEAMPQAVRWAWAVNAASSVLGSAAAIIVAIYFGLNVTLLLGAGLYLAALLTFLVSLLGKNYRQFSITS